MARTRMVMTTRAMTTVLCSTVLTVALSSAATAESKRALVIAEDVSAADKAIALSETFMGLGFDVTRLQEPTQSAIDEAVAALTTEDAPVAIYYAGDNLDLTALTDAPARAPRFVFAETCETANSDLSENVLLVMGSTDCTVDVAAAVTHWLTVPGLATDQWALDDDLFVSSTLMEPFVFRPTTSEVRLSADDYALLDDLSPVAREQMIALWRAAGIAVDVADADEIAPLAPVAVAQDTVRVVAPVQSAVVTDVVRPIAPTLAAGGSPAPSDVTVIARPLSAPIGLPTPGQDGLPTPSILVGFVVDALPDAPEVPEEPVAGAVFGADDVAAREALREQDAALFGGLVETGAFDPPEADVVRALQIELARINCYTAGIDGAWGPGSQRALAAFYEERGSAPPGTEPDLENFRAVIAASGVRCPDPAPRPTPQPVAQTRAAVQPAPAAAPARTQPAPAPAPAPAAPSTPRRSINQTGGSGIFR
ncbi:MAG: hypothetical protein AAFP98_04310 [Pseudomonadota bacterium]